MANIKSIGGNPIVLGLDGLTDDAKAALGSGAKLSAAAESLLGTPDTAQWAQRVNNGSGAATVRSVQGAAVVWSQYVDYAGVQSSTVSGVTITNNGDGSFTVNGTATAQVVFNVGLRKAFPPSHIELIKGCPAGGSTATYRLGDGYGVGSDVGSGLIETHAASAEYEVAQIVVASGYTCDNLVFTPQIFDLTAMFGAGNEPVTVAEFEAMYPESYYPYSAPTLKPVQIAGIRSVGFNQWDEEWELGSISDMGVKQPATDNIRCKNYIPCKPNTTYYCNLLDTGGVYRFFFYDDSKSFISSSATNSKSFTTPANARYMMFRTYIAYGTTYKHDICVNISNPALNGQYKPYTTDSIEWTTQTLRAAGSVADTLYSDHVDVRVGVVDLGTVAWITGTDSTGQYFRVAEAIPDAKSSAGTTVIGNISCAKYTPTSMNNVFDGGIAMAANGGIPYVRDTTYTTAADFKAAMDGVLLFYELTTPTTTPITPALPMTYRVEHGGTEAIIVPTGEISAAPVLTVAEGESAADVVMDALACIAAPDGPVATSNHALGTYLTMQGKLYKVTSAIAVGETIAPNTNVSQTTVMDELIARTA